MNAITMPGFAADAVFETVPRSSTARFLTTFAPRGGVIPQLQKENDSCVGSSCISQDQTAKCCCEAGKRCRSLLSTCVCEDAGRPLGSSAGAFLQPRPSVPTSSSVLTF